MKQIIFVTFFLLVLISCSSSKTIIITSQSSRDNLSLINTTNIKNNIFVYYTIDDHGKILFKVSKISENLSLEKTIEIKDKSSLILILKNDEYIPLNPEISNTNSIYITQPSGEIYNQILIYDDNLNFIENISSNDYSSSISEGKINYYYKTINTGKLEEVSDFHIKEGDNILREKLNYYKFNILEDKEGIYMLRIMRSNYSLFKININIYGNRKNYLNTININDLKYNKQGYDSPSILKYNNRLYLSPFEKLSPKFSFLNIDLKTGNLIEESIIDTTNIAKCSLVKKISKSLRVYRTKNKEILWSYAINDKNNYCICEHENVENMLFIDVLKIKNKLFYTGIIEGLNTSIVIRSI